MFRLLKVENGRENVPNPVYHEVTAGEAVEIGEALVLNAGKLTKCGATTKPEFIANGVKSATDENRKLGVVRTEGNQVYEVPVSAVPTSLKVGDKVTITTDGLQVTATTTSGVITVENLNGAAAAGDKIIVRIV